MRGGSKYRPRRTMADQITISKIELPFEGLHDFVKDAEAENYDFVYTLVNEWNSGEMCFDKPGEKFLGAHIENRVIGVGGLSIDQYANDATVGRLKHIYVLRDFRRRGAAEKLVEQLMMNASDHFQIVRLRVANEYAAKLYKKFGFAETNEPDASHLLRL